MPETNSFLIKSIGFLLGILFFILIFFFANFGADFEKARLVAAIASLMATWWIFESIPLSVTSLLPLILFPLLGIISAADTAAVFMNSTIMLFIGGFIIAIAMEKWNLHRRIALAVIKFYGNSPARIILGFMIATAFISMWISNTATTLMVLPIGLAVIYRTEDEFGIERSSNFSKALMLSIAYSSSIGGIGTLIGTPPNLIFQRMYAINFPNNPQLKFGEWMIFAVPLSAVMLIATWLVLTKFVFKLDGQLRLNGSVIKEEYQKLGKMSYEEKAVLAVFIITSLLWIFRSDLDVGLLKIPGWSQLFESAKFIDDSTIAITMALVLFLIPALSEGYKFKFLLDSDAIKKIPWDIVLLFGGGFALAEGFVESGLSKLIGMQFSALKEIPFVLLILILCTIVVFSSELTSNSAQATIVMPLLASFAIENGINPLALMVPVTFSVSLAFMLPVGTPPNAIVFGSGRLKVWDMVRAGLIVNFIGIVAVTILAFLLFK